MNIKIKNITLCFLLTTPFFSNGQHLPCYKIWSEVFEKLALKPEFAALVEFDIHQAPPKAKAIKTYYSVLTDSISDLSQDDFFSFEHIPLETSISTDFAIESYYNKKGELYQISYLAVSSLFKSTSTSELTLNELVAKKNIYCILHEEEIASLILLNEDDLLVNWKFTSRRDTFLLETSKKNNALSYTKMLNDANFHGTIVYASDTNNYHLLYPKTIDNTQGFYSDCKKEVIYDSDKNIAFVFLFRQMHHTSVEFKLDKKSNLIALTTKKLDDTNLIKQENIPINIVVSDFNNYWVWREAPFYIGWDYRQIEYYK